MLAWGQQKCKYFIYLCLKVVAVHTHSTCINLDRRSLISKQNGKEFVIVVLRSLVECNMIQNIQQPLSPSRYKELCIWLASICAAELQSCRDSFIVFYSINLFWSAAKWIKLVSWHWVGRCFWWQTDSSSWWLLCTVVFVCRKMETWSIKMEPTDNWLNVYMDFKYLIKDPIKSPVRIHILNMSFIYSVVNFPLNKELSHLV